MILILDCDNTLYPASTNLMALNDSGIAGYITHVLGVPREEANQLRLEYLRKYGTTIAGLIAERNVDPDEFMDYVHSYEVDSLVQPNPRLREFLLAVGVPRVVLTSANRLHTEKVARAIGVHDCIDAIYDLKAVDYIGKPHPHAYEKLLADFPGRRAVFVDDRMLNFPPARKLGMINVWVDEGYHPPPSDLTPALSVFHDETRTLRENSDDCVDFTICRIEELADIWPQVVEKVEAK
jgi:putative hydrolase of the HAD superfamily